jgi:hypothetical protein
MRLPRWRFAALLLVALASACATTPRSESAPRGDRNTLTQQDLGETHFLSAYEAVESLRSTWLQPRGPDSFQTPSRVWVYLDNTRLGDIETLRGIHPSTILSIQHFDANGATARWGVGHSAGVIYITTLRAAAPMPASPPQVEQSGHARETPVGAELFVLARDGRGPPPR